MWIQEISLHRVGTDSEFHRIRELPGETVPVNRATLFNSTTNNVTTQEKTATPGSGSYLQWWVSRNTCLLRSRSSQGKCTLLRPISRHFRFQALRNLRLSQLARGPRPSAVFFPCPKSRMGLGSQRYRIWKRLCHQCGRSVTWLLSQFWLGLDFAKCSYIQSMLLK